MLGRLTLYDSVLEVVVANGAYRAINMATFNAGFKLAWFESPSKYKRPPGETSAHSEERHQPTHPLSSNPSMCRPQSCPDNFPSGPSTPSRSEKVTPVPPTAVGREQSRPTARTRRESCHPNSGRRTRPVRGNRSGSDCKLRRSRPKSWWQERVQGRQVSAETLAEVTKGTGRLASSSPKPEL